MPKVPRVPVKDDVSDLLSRAMAVGSIEPIPPNSFQKRHAAVGNRLLADGPVTGSLDCFVDYGSSTVGFAVTPLSSPSKSGRRFAGKLLRIYASDLRITRGPRHPEVETSLSETRARRAIATFSAFSTVAFTDWLRTAESATPRLYEGRPFNFTVLFAKQEEWVTNQNPDSVIRFPKPIPLRSALLDHKWLRATCQSRRVGLLVVGHSGNVVGLVVLPPPQGDPEHPYAPHHDLTGLQQMVVDGTAGLVANRRGDLYLLLSDGAVFCKTQGRWSLHDYSAFEAAVETHTPHMKSAVRLQLIRAVLDLSYERRGALFCIVQPASLPNMVLDFGAPGPSNRLLRLAARGLTIKEWPHRQVIVSGSTVDGATVLDDDGTVLDIACMIATGARGSGPGAAGARSTAGLAVSRFGVAIKVSEDGPITLYSKGKEVAKLG